jgi:hypothetical protein
MVGKQSLRISLVTDKSTRNSTYAHIYWLMTGLTGGNPVVDVNAL